MQLSFYKCDVLLANIFTGDNNETCSGNKQFYQR